MVRGVERCRPTTNSVWRLYRVYCVSSVILWENPRPSENPTSRRDNLYHTATQKSCGASPPPVSPCQEGDERLHNRNTVNGGVRPHGPVGEARVRVLGDRVCRARQERLPTRQDIALKTHPRALRIRPRQGVLELVKVHLEEVGNVHRIIGKTSSLQFMTVNTKTKRWRRGFLCL